jgi:RHS repeat-associated protein
MDVSGNTVVSYAYDSWGKQLSCTGSLASTLGTANPLRYRGYIYDSDTGLYYLQSRYYNPGLGRFTNEDSIIFGGLLSSDQFLYCGNDPVNEIDKSGHDRHTIWVEETDWISESGPPAGAADLFGDVQGLGPVGGEPAEIAAETGVVA